MARLLITGVSGLLGINLAEEMQDRHDVIGVHRGRLTSAPFTLLETDLLEPYAVNSILDNGKPDWLINCASLADLEACEANPGLARNLNTDLPANLALACKKRSIAFVHISTDAVFDGEKTGFYSEEDTPNPLGIYAQTKLAGENEVFTANPQAIVARVNFYGWSLSGKRSLAEFFVYNLTNNKGMSGFTDVIFCPMFVAHTAGLLVKMLEKGLGGLYHVVGKHSMSKYQFGIEIARKFGLSTSQISPKSVLSSGLKARRSHNLSLSTHKLSTVLGEVLPDFSTGLDEFYTQYQQRYPQKIRCYQQA